MPLGSVGSRNRYCHSSSTTPLVNNHMHHPHLLVLSPWSLSLLNHEYCPWICPLLACLALPYYALLRHTLILSCSMPFHLFLLPTCPILPSTCLVLLPICFLLPTHLLLPIHLLLIHHASLRCRLILSCLLLQLEWLSISRMKTSMVSMRKIKRMILNLYRHSRPWYYPLMSSLQLSCQQVKVRTSSLPSLSSFPVPPSHLYSQTKAAMSTILQLGMVHLSLCLADRLHKLMQSLW